MTDGTEAKTVICVDDEAIILMALKQELKLNLGGKAKIETFLRAEEAREKITSCIEEHYSRILVISDWSMPGLRGDEFFRSIPVGYPGIHLILLTGQADETALERLKREVAITQVVKKPWNTWEMMRLVNEALA